MGRGKNRKALCIGLRVHNLKEEELITSSIGRMLQMGGLVSRMGLSFLGEQALSYFLSDSKSRQRKEDKIIQNSLRIVETLGKLRGAPMKLGQMLSLHENLLPPAAVEILRMLQKEAPVVPREAMMEVLHSELGRAFDLLASIEDVPFAAASIGQVYRAKLRDGRDAAVKIQYPGMDEIIRADLKHVRVFLSSLISLFLEADPEPMVQEMEARLVEELDYVKERANMERMSALYADSKDVIVPNTIPELSTGRVLTMEYAAGIAPEDACSDRFLSELQSQWGIVLFRNFLRQLLIHKFVHADPNLGNFAFREDGRIIVYDYGCMKDVPVHLSETYGRLAAAALADRGDLLPEILFRAGLRTVQGAHISQEFFRPYVDVAKIPLSGGEFAFPGEDLYKKIMDIGRQNFREALGLVFPPDIMFIDRTIAGHFGNLCRLRARANWRTVLEAELEAAFPGNFLFEFSGYESSDRSE